MEAFRQFLSKLLVSNQERCKTSFWNKRMVQRKDDEVVVDHMEGVTELSRVTHSRHLFQVSLVLAKKTHQLRGCLVGKPEHNAMVHFVFGRVSSDASKNRKARQGHLLDRYQIAVFQI